MPAGRKTKGKPPPQLRSRTTRSSKGRLVNSEASSGAQLTEQLRSLGLYAANTLGDGNCLFRALSDQVYGSESRHYELRTKICEWIEKHRDRYEPFCEDERGLEVHLRCMKEHGTYGGHMELSAFAHMTQHNVKVIQPGLVYVIEWSAFAPSSSTASSSVKKSYEQYQYESEEEDYDDEGAEADTSVGGALNDREKRRIHREHTREKKEQAEKKVKAKLDKKGKKGHNQLPTPPLTPDEDEGEFDTVYVAYHDWEHFSSIRNLRGPHNGIPRVSELPAGSPSPSAERPSPRSKSKAKATAIVPEIDSDDNDRTIRAKPISKTKKVTLKLSNSGSATPPASAASSVVEPAAPTDSTSTTDPSSAMVVDPTMVPLPSSRSVSPFPSTSQSSTSVAPSSQSSHPLRESFSAGDSIPLDAAKILSSKLSPKRTFAESEGDDYSDTATSSTGSGPDAVKRSRRECTPVSQMPSSTGTETPQCGPLSPMALSDLSALSPLTASSAASSDNESDAGSDGEAEVDSSQDGDDADIEPNLNRSLSAPSASPKRQSKRLAAQGGEEKPLTRRQRKQLGLPKPRQAHVGGVGAGKIVIPGGRYRTRASANTASTEEGKDEWKTNGTGRLDVRGFRELKI